MSAKKEEFMRIYTISELSEMIQIPEGTLRQWEKNLEGIVEVPRDEKGSRYYTEFEITIFKNIKAMREKVLSWSVIKEVLKKSEGAPKDDSPAPLVIPTVPKMTQTEAIQSLQEIRSAIEGFEQKMASVVQTEIKKEVAAAVEPITKALARISDREKEQEQEIKMNSLLQEMESMKQMIEEMQKEQKKGFFSRLFRK